MKAIKRGGGVFGLGSRTVWPAFQLSGYVFVKYAFSKMLRRYCNAWSGRCFNMVHDIFESPGLVGDLLLIICLTCSSEKLRVERAEPLRGLDKCLRNSSW